MKIKAISHIGFNSKDLEKSIEFYCKYFGCKEKFTLTYGDMVADLEKKLQGSEPSFLAQLRAFANQKWSVYLQVSETSFIELFNQLGATVPFLPEKQHLNYTHFSLEVEDIKALREEIINNGGEEYLDTEITKGIENTLQMWMHDPDGNKFEIMEYTPQSYQVVGR